MAFELPDLCPLLLEPRLLPKLWGGRRLESYGKALPAGLAIGESWELYDDAKGSARVAAGPAAGLSLRQLCEGWGEDLLGLGHGAWARRFPLLIKLIDANQDLSVQVHPDDALALELEGPQALGKSEAWVVLEARPGSRLLSGFLQGVDAAALQRGLQQGNLESLLRREAVALGDAFDIPAGRVHAIGAGCLLAEVQQNSDATYRLWDYGRLEGGKPRALHVERALRALCLDAPFAQSGGRLQPQTSAHPWGREEALLQSPYFSLRRLRLAGEAPLAPAGAPRILMVLQGQLQLAWGAGQGMMVPGGSTVLVPAALAASLRPATGSATVLQIEPR